MVNETRSKGRFCDIAGENRGLWCDASGPSV